MHSTFHASYEDRAALPNTSQLQTYLLHLIALKKTNLSLSADVTTTAELLAVAEEVGDSICILKTHADIIDDWGDRTVRGLREIAKRKRFLIFEDRKFGDIGSMFHASIVSRLHIWSIRLWLPRVKLSQLAFVYQVLSALSTSKKTQILSSRIARILSRSHLELRVIY